MVYYNKLLYSFIHFNKIFVESKLIDTRRATLEGERKYLNQNTQNTITKCYKDYSYVINLYRYYIIFLL